MKFKSFMKVFDEQLFQAIHKLNDYPAYHKIIETYNSFDEKKQVLANYALVLVTFLLPALLTLTFYIIYQSSVNELAEKELVIEKTATIINQSKSLDKQTRILFGRPIATQSDLNNRISSISNSAGIDSSNLKVINFDQYENAGISEVKGTLKFNGISSKNIYELIQRLAIREKFKVSRINIDKNLTNQLLEGEFDFLYFSKVVKNDDE